MMENSSQSLRVESNIAKMLEQAINLFRDTDLTELADKWERILRNYYRKKSFKLLSKKEF